MSWHFLERWLEKTNQHSTLLGKFWITFLIVVRMVVVASIGDRVYNDDQSEFKCNTQQPGCTNVCFNKFSPMSHLRFWSFQIIFVATPSVIYIVYSGHTSKLKKAQSKRPRPSHIEEADDGDDEGEEQHQEVNQDKQQQGNVTAGSKRDTRNFSILSGNKSRRDVIRRAMTSSSGGGRKSRKSRKATPPNYEEGGQYGNFPRSAVIRIVNPEMLERQGRGSSNTGENPIVRSRSGSRLLGQESSKKDKKKKHNNNNNNNNTNQDEQKEQQQQPSNNQFAFVWREVGQQKKDKQQEGRSNRGSDPNVSKKWNKNDDIQQPERASLAAKDQVHHSNDARYMDVVSQHQLNMMPTAPPEYPGLANANFVHPDYNATTGVMTQGRKGSPSKGSKMSFKRSGKMISEGSQMDAEALERKMLMKQKKMQMSKPLPAYPAFAQHFRYYFISVVMRLCMEVFFVYMQVRLYGFSVQELFKCERKPCPNMVDCFVSRPKEKTIFLWFMFCYSCLCVLLNFMEIMHLIYSYFTKYSKRARMCHQPLQADESKNMSVGNMDVIKVSSEDRGRTKGHELVSIAGHGRTQKEMNKYYKDKWDKKDIWKRGDLLKYGLYYDKHHLVGTNSHDMSDYEAMDYRDGGVGDSDDGMSMNDSEMDRMAPDQLDDINIEYNEIDINDIPTFEDDVNDVMNNNDDMM